MFTSVKARRNRLNYTGIKLPAPKNTSVSEVEQAHLQLQLAYDTKSGIRGKPFIQHHSLQNRRLTIITRAGAKI